MEAFKPNVANLQNVSGNFKRLLNSKIDKRMKRFYNLILLLFITSGQLFGQNISTENLIKKIVMYDLVKVFNPDSISEGEEVGEQKYIRDEPLGFIDTCYQRFQIHFSKFSKSQTNPYLYQISGKTKVKDNICNFSGKLTVVEVEYDTSSLMKNIGLPMYKRGYITSQLTINEDDKQMGSGVIEGSLYTDFYIDNRDKIHYDALLLVADGFRNNQFIGKWTSYKTSKSKKCNWGDYRIPKSGDLDIGTGRFHPNEKYIDNGWKSYLLNLRSNFETAESAEVKEANRIENIKWWL